MSRGPGRWQRAILAILERKRDTADYRYIRHSYPVAVDTLIERKYPELWEANHHSSVEKYPLQYGWVSVADLRAECGAESMAAYKALLRALDTLEVAGQIQCQEIRGDGRNRDVRKRLARISVDKCEPSATPVNTYKGEDYE